MAIKLVVSDIDGTLIDGTEAIAPELIEAAQKCKEHGVVFSFATGRTKELVARLVKTVGITSPVCHLQWCLHFSGRKVPCLTQFLSRTDFINHSQSRRRRSDCHPLRRADGTRTAADRLC